MKCISNEHLFGAETIDLRKGLKKRESLGPTFRTWPPSWSRLTTGVDKRNIAISLLLLVSSHFFLLAFKSLPLLVILSPHTVVTIVSCLPLYIRNLIHIH